MDKCSNVHCDTCHPLAPWERELFAISEPYVDLDVWVSATESLHFERVRGISIKDGVLTFENDDNRLFFVPNVTYWTTDASEL